MSSETVSKEEKVARKAEEFLPGIKEDTVRREFEKLLKEYKKLARRSEKIQKMADSFQNQIQHENEFLYADKKSRAKNVMESRKKILAQNQQRLIDNQKTIDELQQRLAEQDGSQETIKKAALQMRKMKQLNTALKEKLKLVTESTDFGKILEREVARAKTYKYPLTLLSVQIDQYEQVEAKLEEEELFKVRAMLKGVIRDNLEVFDIVEQERDGIYRVILVDIQLDEVKEFVSFLKEEILRKTKNTENVIVTASYGISQLHGEGDKAELLLERCNIALRECKGRNSLVIK